MTEHEHDEGLAPVEWLLLVPTAAVWMVNGLAGFLLFSIFIGYAVYRQNPAEFRALVDAPARLTARPGRGQRRPPSDDDAYLQGLLASGPEVDSQPSQAPALVPWRQWRIRAVKAHHLLIIGNTDSGKTTLARALLTGKRGAIIVLDPKNRPGKWGDIAAIGLDDDAGYSQIERALQHVLTELRRRQRALNDGSDDFTPLAVVVDEAPDVADEAPSFATVFKRVGSVGRELNISLIALSQRHTVKALGISGDGQARDNFTKILMGKFARRAMPALSGQPYCAVLDDDDELQALDVAPLPTYARLPIKAGVVSGFAMGDTRDDTRGTRYPAGTGPVGAGIAPDTSESDDDTSPGTWYDTSPDTSPDTSQGDDDGITPEQIRAWHAAGLSKRKIKDRLRGSGSRRQARLNAALASEGDDGPPSAFGWLNDDGA